MGNTTRRAWATDWLLPVVVLVALTIPFWTTPLDVSIVARFHVPGAGWPHGSTEPWRFLKHYGMIPAWGVAGAGLVLLLAASWSRRARRHWRAASFLVMVIAVGPGLIVNDVFKEHWGRPRPRDLTVFEGDRAYVKPWVKRPAENGNSFPSGHAATAFYLMSPYFVFRRQSRRVARWFLVIGAGYGTLVGLARMIQGAHFPSDVIWAFGFVHLTAATFAYLLDLDRERPGVAPDPRNP